jgi:acyl carrier protein
MDTLLRDLKVLLAKALRDTSRAPQVSDDADIVNGLGLDSLQMIAFLLDVETHFGVQLDFETIDLSVLGSVRAFAQVIETLRTTQRGG